MELNSCATPRQSQPGLQNVFTSYFPAGVQQLFPFMAAGGSPPVHQQHVTDGTTHLSSFVIRCVQGLAAWSPRSCSPKTCARVIRDHLGKVDQSLQHSGSHDTRALLCCLCVRFSGGFHGSEVMFPHCFWLWWNMCCTLSPNPGRPTPDSSFPSFKGTLAVWLARGRAMGVSK